MPRHGSNAIPASSLSEHNALRHVPQNYGKKLKLSSKLVAPGSGHAGDEPHSDHAIGWAKDRKDYNRSRLHSSLGMCPMDFEKTVTNTPTEPKSVTNKAI